MIEEKYLFILLIFLLIIALSVIFFLKWGRNKQPIEEDFCVQLNENLFKNICRSMMSNSIDICDNSGDYDEFCYDVILEVMSFSKETCESINDDYNKLLCYKKLAIKSKNPELCMNWEECYLELASKTSNEELCDFFQEELFEQMCLGFVNKNREYCERLEDEFSKKICFSKLPKILEDCKIEENYNDDCLSKLAIQKKDTSLCEMMDSASEELECVLNIKNDIRYCEDYSGRSRDVCLIYYLKNEMKREG